MPRRIRALAAGALLVRHYPPDGKRHEAALVLGGVLARPPGFEAADIERFVTAVARVANDEEAAERGRSSANFLAGLAREQAIAERGRLLGSEKWQGPLAAPLPPSATIELVGL